MSEPDTYCLFGNPVYWGWLGPNRHECEPCRSFLSRDDLLFVMKTCYEDHKKYWLHDGKDIYGTVHSCECDHTETETYPAEVINGELYPEWTDTRTYHLLSPEQTQVMVVVCMAELNEYGHDTYIDLQYALPDSPAGASYGFNRETKEISCYAD